MSKEDVKNIVLDTFLKVSLSISDQFPKELLRNLYNILQTHQFDRDNAASLQEIKLLINNFIEKKSSKVNGEDK